MVQDLLSFTHPKSRTTRSARQMAEAKPALTEEERVNEEAGVQTLEADQDRDTFLPRPSDDPNDPLNWPMYLKVTSIFVT
jgi:hypothetical protein